MTSFKHYIFGIHIPVFLGWLIPLCVYDPSGYSTREQLARGRFFEGLQNYMENKNKGSENKIMLGDFNCTMDKMDRDGENKTQRLHWCCSNYALSKLIMNNGLEDLWRSENPDSPEFTRFDRIQDRQGLY